MLIREVQKCPNVKKWDFDNNVVYFTEQGLTFINRSQCYGGRRDRDRMVIGFTTTYAISAYHH